MAVETVERAIHRRQRATGSDDGVPLLSIESTSEPTVTLSVTPSAESREAFALLEAAGIDFRAVPAPDGGVLLAEFGGITYEGVDGVRLLAAALNEFKRVLIAGVEANLPELIASADPRVGRKAAEQRRLWLEEARSVLDRELARA